jgi:UDP-N-acetylmuramyl pentapeptide phosphotransferase/UDP-N-acetylglucosamine-1-phosphate transferase
LHAAAVPRTGGLALLAGVLCGWALLGQSWLLPVITSVFLIMLVSFVDDLQGLNVRWRLLAHFLIVGGVLQFELQLGHSWLWGFLIAIAIIWMTNLYNFMDGSDGLAGGMALIGFGTYAVAAWWAGDSYLAIVNLTVASSALAFLAYNFSPARIFMGDAGSIPLGFLSAILGLIGWQSDLWPLWFPVLVFSPFVVDATVTLIKRLLRREKFWQAHRSHYYQRLVQMGWGHKKTAIFEYLLMLGCGVTAIGLLHQPRAWYLPILLLWAVIYIAVMMWIDKLWKRHLNASINL